jgi:hypothetical protein
MSFTCQGRAHGRDGEYKRGKLKNQDCSIERVIDTHLHAALLHCEQHVLGLYVGMYYALAVHIIQSVQELSHDFLYVHDRERFEFPENNSMIKIAILQVLKPSKFQTVLS